MRPYNWDGAIVGVPYQDTHEVSAIQKYPIGTIYERYGRRFRYCRAVEAILYSGLGCPNIAMTPWNAENINRKVTSITAAKKGENSVICVHGAGAHTLDDFQGGYITFYDIDTALNSGNHQSYGVIGSDVSIDTTHTKIYLDEPLACDITLLGAGAGNADLYQSPYRNVGASNSLSLYASAVCIPQVPVPLATPYFWGQTRGPCLVWPTAGITASYTRLVVFSEDGSISPMIDAKPALQIAGYLICKNSAADDDAEIMLMLE